MNKEQKAATIDEIAAQIEGADAIFAVDYRGISVPQAAELRGRLREADASFRVVKNRLTKLAAQKAGEDRLEDLLQGPTALTFVRGDTALAAKALSTFNKENDVLTFKGGFMDGLLLDEERFKSIARLPGRDVLNGQLAGVVASPLTGLVRGLGSMIQGLALQLGQIAEKGLVSGEAPAEESGEAPAEEADAGPADAPVEEPPTESSAQNEPPGEEPSKAEGEDPAEESGGDEPDEQGGGEQPADEQGGEEPADEQGGGEEPVAEQPAGDEETSDSEDDASKEEE